MMLRYDAVYIMVIYHQADKLQSNHVTDAKQPKCRDILQNT